jgi:hypothetical protein
MGRAEGGFQIKSGMTKFYKNNGCTSLKAKAGQNEFGFDTGAAESRSVAKRMFELLSCFCLERHYLLFWIPDQVRNSGSP